MATITGEELIKHNTKDSCWIAIHGQVYDVTSFIDHHPGGASLILKLGGQDATEQYETFHDAGLVAKTLDASARKGTIDAASIPKFQPASATKAASS